MGKQDYYIKKLMGIYRIAHKVSGMCYVGQSVDMIQRWRQHTTPNKSCVSKAIAAEPDQFTFEILEECSKEELNSREKHWIEFFNCISPSGYNKTVGGSSYAIASEETKKKLSERAKNRIFSEETKKKMSNSAKGKPKSDEVKQKLSEAKKGKKHGPMTEEQKKKISESQQKRWQRTKLTE